jgi:hypothetical protein
LARLSHPPRPRDVTITSAANPPNLPLNHPPTITSTSAQTSTTDTPISNLAISASDADGNLLTYSASGLPAGLGINPTSGLISGTPTIPGSYTVTVTVNDGFVGGTASASFGWNVAAADGSAMQIFSAPGAITINDNAIATPYPASVIVSGMSGTISKVVVTLKGLPVIDRMLVQLGGNHLPQPVCPHWRSLTVRVTLYLSLLFGNQYLCGCFIFRRSCLLSGCCGEQAG